MVLDVSVFSRNYRYDCSLIRHNDSNISVRVTEFAVKHSQEQLLSRQSTVLSAAAGTKSALLLERFGDRDEAQIEALSLPVPISICASFANSRIYAEAIEMIWAHSDPAKLSEFVRALVCPCQIQVIVDKLQPDIIFTVAQADSAVHRVLERNLWKQFIPSAELVISRSNIGGAFSIDDAWLRAPIKRARRL